MHQTYSDTTMYFFTPVLWIPSNTQWNQLTKIISLPGTSWVKLNVWKKEKIKLCNVGIPKRKTLGSTATDTPSVHICPTIKTIKLNNFILTAHCAELTILQCVSRNLLRHTAGSHGHVGHYIKRVVTCRLQIIHNVASCVISNHCLVLFIVQTCGYKQSNQ